MFINTFIILVWSDIRTSSIVDQIIAKFPDQSKNHIKPLCGLPVSPYFSALKIRWMKDNVPTVRKAMRDRRCKVGTMDTWIVWVCEYDVFERRTYLECKQLLCLTAKGNIDDEHS